jgi:uncharacterized protein (DUF1697 family)
MPRYAAFLRGVSPMNAKMPELKRAFEAAGFTGVRTVISSGNVVFDARRATESSLQQRSEKAMAEHLGQAFLTMVRPVEMLREMLASDPYREFGLDPSAKRIVTFLRDEPTVTMALPVEQDGARLLALGGKELFSAYLPSPKGPVFMTLIERNFGKELTTRTWDSVGKVARA